MRLSPLAPALALLLAACGPSDPIAHQAADREADEIFAPSDATPPGADPIVLPPDRGPSGLQPGFYVQDLGDGRRRVIIVEPRRPDQPPYTVVPKG